MHYKKNWNFEMIEGFIINGVNQDDAIAIVTSSVQWLATALGNYY